MGLKWGLEGRAIDGMELELAELRAKMEDAYLNDDDEEINFINDQIDEIEVRPDEELGIPSVGLDNVATDWYLEYIKNQREANPAENYWNKPEEELINLNQGQLVWELGPKDKRGLLIRAYMDAQCVAEAEWLSDKSRELAYDKMTPEEMETYALLLHEEFMDYTGTRASRVKEPTPDASGEAWQIYEVALAIEWLLYWAYKGFSKIPV